MSQEIRDTFIFYRSFYEMAKEMSDVERLSFFDAICEYALNFKEVELKGIAKICFIGAKPNISANIKRYQNGKLGAEHGKKGGRPKTPKKPLNNPSGDFENNPKETPNKNKDVNNNKDLECKSELEMKIIIPKPKGFTPPTLEEVKKYCLERKNNVKPQKWLDHYQSNGWKVGKNQMKDWKAAIRKWEDSDYNQPTQNNETLCEQINKIIGENLISQIKVSGSKAELYFENEANHKKLTSKAQSLRNEIKNKITTELGTTSFELKF